jgi:transcriptional regulator of acetoin/glycerol metabolism
LQHILEQHHWHMERAAASLDIHRSTLWRYMQRFGITRRN